MEIPYIIVSFIDVINEGLLSDKEVKLIEKFRAIYKKEEEKFNYDDYQILYALKNNNWRNEEAYENYLKKIDNEKLFPLIKKENKK